MSKNNDDWCLGYDCNGEEIEEESFLIAEDVPYEKTEEHPYADPRVYFAVKLRDGKAYAISICDEKREKLIREREHIPADEDVPTLIKPISAMQHYELAFNINYDYDIDELRQEIMESLKKKPIEKDIKFINDDILLLRREGVDVGEISNGSYTFNDEYDMKANFFMALCEAHFEKSWKARTPSEEKFVGVLDTPEGVVVMQISMEYWDDFNVSEKEVVPKYDGYTREDIKKRIKSLGKLKNNNNQTNTNKGEQ